MFTFCPASSKFYSVLPSSRSIIIWGCRVYQPVKKVFSLAEHPCSCKTWTTACVKERFDVLRYSISSLKSRQFMWISLGLLVCSEKQRFGLPRQRPALSVYKADLWMLWISLVRRINSCWKCLLFAILCPSWNRFPNSRTKETWKVLFTYGYFYFYFCDTHHQYVHLHF